MTYNFERRPEEEFMFLTFFTNIKTSVLAPTAHSHVDNYIRAYMHVHTLMYTSIRAFIHTHINVTTCIHIQLPYAHSFIHT